MSIESPNNNGISRYLEFIARFTRRYPARKARFYDISIAGLPEGEVDEPEPGVTTSDSLPTSDEPDTP